jgi:hypothetical protein
MRRTFQTAFILSGIILVLAIVASAGGLFIPDLYLDPDLIKQAWFGSDITTLFLAIPLFIVSLRFAMQGSLRAQLIWIGLLGYMFYNYAFYLFGATFNKFFLIYVALFALSLYSLVTALSNLPFKTIQDRFDKKTPVKALSIFMILIALPLAVFELTLTLTAIFSGTVPTVPPLIFALDLSFVIPNMILAAVLLWKHHRWGYILTAMMMVKGFTYGINLIISAASVAEFKLSGTWDPLTPFYLFIAVGSLLYGWLLLKNMKD